LVHPNIIKMRATARVAPYDGRYFIVMDRLYDTLETRIHKRWAAAAKFHKGPVGRLAGGRKKASALYEERLVAAYDLAAAVQYMHAHRILYRDLKTENVGFDIVSRKRLRETLVGWLVGWRVRRHDLCTSGWNGRRWKDDTIYQDATIVTMTLFISLPQTHSSTHLTSFSICNSMPWYMTTNEQRGDIKIFDFGLAKELTGLTADADGTYNLTADTGSPRYMAPEVALGQPYNEKCDCYSFAVMFWEMMTLQIPFHLFTLAKLHERVWAGAEQKRPYVDQAFWSLPLQLCLKRSWTSDVKFRYDMSQVAGILKNQLVTIRGGDAQGLEHNRRRSTFVFRPRKV
jgi:serine/threonine protein kinase